VRTAGRQIGGVIARVPVLTLLLVVLLPTPASAQSRPRRAIILSLPGLALEDVRPERTPLLAGLSRRSEVALVNVVNRASFSEDARAWDPVASGYLTLGMGGRGRSPALGAEAGVDLLPGTVAAVQAANEGGPRAVQPGWLGTALHHAGLKTAVLGCADDLYTVRSDVLLAAMDETGLVDYGDVSPRCLRRNAARPYGLESDVDYLLARERELPADLTWIDPGDLQRLERYSPLCTPAMVARHRQAALEQAERLLAGALAQSRATGGIVLVVAPCGAPRADGRRRTLAPLVWYDPQAPPGLLASGSTRRPGLVPLADLAGALVRRLTGRADVAPNLVKSAPGPHAWMRVQRLDDAIERADAWRAPGIRFVQFLLLAAALLAALAARPNGTHGARAVAAAAPLAIFAAACFILPGGPDPVPAITMILALVTALIARRDARRQLALLYGGLAVGVALDMAAGGRALGDSVLGYSLALGARYYGIGNEWMGVIIGSALAALLLGGVPERWRLAGVAVLLALVLLFAAPAVGANFGGALTALAAVAVFAAFSAREGRRLRALVGALAAAAALLAAGIAWDALRHPAQQTHVGRLLASLLGGSGDLGATIAGKLLVNWRVSRSFWGLLILIEGAVAWWIAARPAAVKSPERRRATALFAIAAAAAWLFNDSGAVAAALLLAPCPGALLLGVPSSEFRVPSWHEPGPELGTRNPELGTPT
jgi:hypothetical protein